MARAKGFICFYCKKEGLSYAEICEHKKRHMKKELTKDMIMEEFITELSKW